MKKEKINRSDTVNLIVSHLTGLSDAKQEKALREWLKEEGNARFYDQVSGPGKLSDDLNGFGRYDAHADWHNLAPRLRPRRTLALKATLYATAAALAVGVFFHFVTAEKKHNTTFHVSGKSDYLAGIKPGNAKASLIIDDGMVIDLESGSAIGIAEIETNEEGKLVYNHPNGEEKLTWHTLQVPRGGEYTVVLPDKTVVNLNANSKLGYPSRFADGAREVVLNGEAYFVVSHDPANPFTVRTEGMDIQVLGTSFNMKAYSGESLQTTLIEGSVKVTTAAGNVTIYPGQQAQFDQGRLTVRQVDVQPYLSERYSRFLFDDELLADVLRKIERWYNIDIFVADQSVYGLRFTGNLPKYEDLSKVLHLLELTTNIRFNLENKRLVVEQELLPDKTLH